MNNYYEYFYSWSTILWFFYCWKKRKKEALGLLGLLLVVLLICIAGPVNGSYYRYLHPIAMCLPAVLLSGRYFIEEGE